MKQHVLREGHIHGGEDKRPGAPSPTYSAVCVHFVCKKWKIKLLCQLNRFSFSLTDRMELNLVGLKLYEEVTPCITS